MRLWVARKKYQNMLKYYYYLKQLACDEVNVLKNEAINDQLRNLVNLEFPTKTKNFEALYAIVRNHFQNKKSDSKMNITEKNIHFFWEEFKCINKITKIRSHRNETSEKNMLTQLNYLSKPTISNKESIIIETPQMYKAKQFLEFYLTLKKRKLNRMERTEVLLKLKELLECYKEVNLTYPVINLINRELTLLNIIKLNDSQLESLRKRIEVNLQCIMKQPEINPAIALTPWPTHLIVCHSCKKLKPLNRSKMNLDLTNTTMCKNCSHLQCITVKRINMMPYENMFNTIMATELRLETKSDIMFFLCPEDIYYLVEIIWRGRSVLNESKDITQLQLIRWDNQLDWSPSNTILLTIDEAVVHSKIRELNKVYAPLFIDLILQKHMIARNYFKGLEKAIDYCDRKRYQRKKNHS